jgi:hypothetical protein
MSYDFDYYRGEDLRAPLKPVKPVLGRNPTAIDARAFADALEEYEREFRSYEENKSYYQHQLSARHREFEDKMKKDYGLDDDEFAAIWSEAYNRGHSGGFSEIYQEFDSLFDFALKYTEIVNKKKKQG